MAIQRKKINKSTETVLEKDVMSEALANFKTTILRKLEELKEDVEKVRKTMCEQNGNVHKELENLRRNQKVILELKSTVMVKKNSLEEFKGQRKNQ